MAAYSAEESEIASRDEANAEGLSEAYAAQVARELAAARAAAERAAKEAAARVARAAKRAATVVKRVAVAAGKAVYKASGIQSIVSCVTDPSLASCVQAAVAVVGVALTVATGGAGAAVDVGLDAAADAATDVAVDAAEGASETAAEDAGAGAEAATCGGASFTASTKVLLASGAAIPIGQLKPGDKVLATNTKSGKTQAEPVSAVLLHHDTDLYDLTVKTARGTAVIDTTSSHLFWDPVKRQWVKAGSLRSGEALKAPGGAIAYADGGAVPPDHNGWMWDLTVTGGDDHDFYVDTAVATVLVHNCDPAAEGASIPDSTIIARGGQGPLKPPGEGFSGAQGQTAEEAGQGVVHGSFRWATAGDIRAGGGTVEPAPEFNEGVGQTNYQHVDVCLGEGACQWSDSTQNVAKSLRFGGKDYPFYGSYLDWGP
jgi:hypothetical protein